MTLDHTSTNGVYGLLTSLKGQREKTIFKKEKLLGRHGDTFHPRKERQADFCAFEAGIPGQQQLHRETLSQKGVRRYRLLAPIEK